MRRRVELWYREFVDVSTRRVVSRPLMSTWHDSGLSIERMDEHLQVASELDRYVVGACFGGSAQLSITLARVGASSALDQRSS
jgi:hypothetical protein